MIVVEVLLGLNLFVLGLCALRPQLSKRGQDAWLLADRALPPAEGGSQPGRRVDAGAVILPFRAPTRPNLGPSERRRSISQHPSGSPVIHGGG
jgi:hypothetical protein